MSSEKFHTCIQLCVQSAVLSSKCAAACLNEKNFEHLLACIKMNRDCAALCEAAMSAMTNRNPLAEEVCAVCADMCIACATECEKHQHSHCLEAAKACRACAAECRVVAGASAAA